MSIKIIKAKNADYIGETIDGNPHGRGVLYFANGDLYEVDFVDGNPSGKGIFYFANGDRYEGDFVYGKRTGNRRQTSSWI